MPARSKLETRNCMSCLFPTLCATGRREGLDASLIASSALGELRYVPMQIKDVAKAYEAKADEELIHLATESGQLTPEAKSALRNELAKRRIDSPKQLNLPEESEQGKIEQSGTRGALVLGDSQSVGEFVAEIHRVYHDQFWLYVKLTAPSVVVATIAMFMVRYEVREIARHLLRGLEMQGHGILEIWLVNSAGYLVGWMAFAFSFAAICVAIRQIAAGAVTSAQDAIAGVRERIGPFLRLSLLLYFLLVFAFTAAFRLVDGVFWVLRELHIDRSDFTIQVVVYGFGGLAVLVFSRLVLAIPAIVLDNCGVVRAMFRSDELTEGKWLTLAVLLAEGLIGSYVASKGPFWLASWIPANISLPSWFPWILTAVSMAGVTVVEATMLIGFVLLYLRMSPVSTSSEALARELA
jgi:hypothetical protein